MRYPQNLVNDYFKEKTFAPTYYWVNIWVQNSMNRVYVNKMLRKRPFKSVKFIFNPPKWSSQTSPVWWREETLWNINFIRKEKVYTKLKYSRTQSYDIVSAGVAALFAGLLGFLICEKFGFELLDGGDFLFLFLYVVGLSFTLKLFFRIYTGSVRSFVQLIVSSVVHWLQWLVYLPLLWLFPSFIDGDDEEEDE